MEGYAIIVLRLGLGVTFFLSSFFLFSNKKKWGKMLLTWARNSLPVPVDIAMSLSAMYVFFQGLWFLSGIFPWYAGVFAAIYLLQTLFATGINDMTYRDVGLLMMCFALILLTSPK